jgi:transglutaminase-like putative cysteine protease
MRLNITHRIECRYGDPVNYALQRLRLVPSSGSTQKVRSWTLSIEGAREEVRFSDHFENETRLISVSGDPKLVSFEASGEVETFNKAGVTGFHRGFAPLWLFRRDTPLTLPDETARALAAAIGDGDDIARLHQLMGAIHERVAEAAAGTQAAEARQTMVQGDQAMVQGGPAAARTTGLREDHAETFIVAARLLGFPARYVSGYLMPDGVAAEAMSHAWAEAHVTGLGWVGFDATHDMSPDETYVRIAVGRDHREATPVSGIRLGQTEERLAMSVTVEQ